MPKKRTPLESGTASDEFPAARAETSEKDLKEGERRRAGVRVEEE
jgi:hypothetical protein